MYTNSLEPMKNQKFKKQRENEYGSKDQRQKQRKPDYSQLRQNKREV